MSGNHIHFNELFGAVYRPKITLMFQSLPTVVHIKRRGKIFKVKGGKPSNLVVSMRWSMNGCVDKRIISRTINFNSSPMDLTTRYSFQ